MWKCLVLFALFPFCASQSLSKEEIDASISSAIQGLIDKEAEYAKTLSDFAQEIKTCSKSLTSEKVVEALDNMASIIEQQSTLKSFSPYENISTCADINYKIMMIELDQEKLRLLISKAISNLTEINTHYTALYTASVLSPPIAACVSNIFQEVLTINNENGIYRSVLATNFGQNGYFSSILNGFKRDYCKCLQKAGITGYNSTLEKNVQVRFGKFKNFKWGQGQDTLNFEKFSHM